MRRTTDADGHASFPGTRGFEREQEPTVYLVQSAGDMAFIPFERSSRRLNLSRFDVGGVYSQEQDGGGGEGRLGALFVQRSRASIVPGNQSAWAVVKSEPLNNVEGIPVEIAIFRAGRWTAGVSVTG
ncbi:MAG: hypothetical protein R2864_08795 [Syntrophotaleaceae bacterium]